jgi:hypothetical protein
MSDKTDSARERISDAADELNQDDDDRSREEYPTEKRAEAIRETEEKS